MRKKITLVITIVFASMILLSGCGKSKEQKSDVKKYPVKTVQLQDQSCPISLEYVGTTGGSAVKKLSFKSSAKIAKIYVSKGQFVKAGDKLIELDQSDLQYAADAAKAQMDGASEQYDKAVNGAQQEDISKAQIAEQNAQDTYNHEKDLYDKLTQLYNSGSIPQQQVLDEKLKLDSCENSVNAAQQTLSQIQSGTREEDKQTLLDQLNAAKANYEAKQNLLQDSTMVADSDGYIGDIVGKEGEVEAAGNPVVIFRTTDQIVTVGLSEDDMKKVQVGTEAQVKIDDSEGEGEINNIAQIPDKQTNTYTAEIKLSKKISDDKFCIGATTKVYFGIGNKNSILIPIICVLNDGTDYVFVVENGRAVRKEVTLGDINDDKVSVEGLKAGDKLVIEGMKNIKAGYQVISN